MNPIQFFKRWKKGFKDITIEQQLKAKIVGLRGNIFGMLSGCLSFTIYLIVAKDWKWWWSIIVFICGAYLNYIELIGVKQQYKQAKEIQSIINESKVKENG